ncbi:dienelactone hydrolase family protein [Elioraea sp.]|uniref:dienelactone hydrolase family protein n=1 Tax=Elioraea sp. TaxID=2185103 RepID=UPI0021DF1899|nr:dienelactone hydrolase family protein [Elioraea sp.]GIX10862.1 MAG: dienelactone hydrolase [Elioraea sp.]
MSLRRLAALAIAAALLAGPLRAEGPQRVTVPSRDGTALDAVLLMPQGTGPHAAVILLHGCGGRDARDGRLDARHADWAARLVAAGFVVLLPESFASRGQGPQCGVRDRRILPWRERRADALGARDWLAGQPFVRAGAIALMGWSHGGSTVLATADAPGFAAFIAFYPGCTRALQGGRLVPAAPLLLLMGEADDWTPPEPCRLLAERAGSAVTYVGYPGAFHGFDAPDRPPRLRRGFAFTGRGDGTAHVGTDPAARADALARVPAWLTRHTGNR